MIHTRPSFIFAESSSIKAQWAAMRRVRLAQEAKMRDAYLRVMGEFGREANLTQLARSVYERNLKALPLNILDEEITNATYDLLRDTMRLAGESQIPFIPGAAEGALSFDLLNPRAVEYISAHTAKLVTRVSDDVKLTIQYITNRSFVDGIPPEEAAKYIKQTIGLLPRHAAAVVNYRQRLLADGVNPSLANAQAKIYADRLLMFRADMIARTETNYASSGGQQELWNQATEEGLLDPAKTERAWLVTHDDRLSKNRCKPMSGQTRPLKKEFLTGEGKLVMTPPAGVFCRCGMGLKFLD